ncbi:MAG: hypothetical protein Q8M79_08485 [Dehalococcoidia bacterium]|nr:hypothetical protein [Dehalococcoidia bacterium]
MPPRILDHREGLELSDEAVGQRVNELHALRTLGQGMVQVAAWVAEAEAQIRSQMGSGYTAYAWGNGPMFDGIPMGLVPSWFDWYANSATKYVQLVGWLAFDGDRRSIQRYASQVLGTALTWRNKVGAHFALVDPRDEDSPADLAASVIVPVGWVFDRLMTQPFTLGMTRDGESHKSRDLSWSVTGLHDELRNRYVRAA